MGSQHSAEAAKAFVPVYGSVRAYTLSTENQRLIAQIEALNNGKASTSQQLINQVRQMGISWQQDGETVAEFIERLINTLEQTEIDIDALKENTVALKEQTELWRTIYKEQLRTRRPPTE